MGAGENRGLTSHGCLATSQAPGSPLVGSCAANGVEDLCAQRRRIVVLLPEDAQLVHQPALEGGMRAASLALGEMGVDGRNCGLVERAVEVIPEGADDVAAVERRHGGA